MTHAELVVMRTIKEHASTVVWGNGILKAFGMSHRNLMRRLRKRKFNIKPVLNALEERGYISSEKDDKGTYWILTAKGKEYDPPPPKRAKSSKRENTAKGERNGTPTR